jgi:hypothetical protein
MKGGIVMKSSIEHRSLQAVRRAITALRCSALVLLALSAMSAEAQQPGDFKYMVNNGTAVITGYVGVVGNVVIPSAISNLTVTGIGDWAFLRCSALTITIPNSVTSMGHGAFAGCSILTSITIPSSITNIGDSTFYDCSSLTSITIPNSVSRIGDSEFGNCSSLTSVAIPNSVTSIGSSAFAECSSLTNISIPNGVTSIGGFTFENTALTKITIPNGVTSIGIFAFNVCSHLTSINIPDSVTTIGERAFSFTPLTTITIPDSVTSIGASAFGCCSSLSSVYFQGNTPMATYIFEYYDESYPPHVVYDSLTVYYRVGTTGWSSSFCGQPTAPCTATTPEMVPHAWLDQHFQNLTNDSAYEQSAMADPDGDGMATWKDYVAGTDPTNRASRFQAAIVSSGSGPPIISWSPDLGSDRIYVVMGKTNLTDTAWTTPPAAGTRYFCVIVRMS